MYRGKNGVALPPHKEPPGQRPRLVSYSPLFHFLISTTPNVLRRLWTPNIRLVNYATYLALVDKIASMEGLITFNTFLLQMANLKRSSIITLYDDA